MGIRDCRMGRERDKAVREESAPNLARTECEITNAYMSSPKQARSHGRSVQCKGPREPTTVVKDPVTYDRPTYRYGDASRAICAHVQRRHAMEYYPALVTLCWKAGTWRYRTSRWSATITCKFWRFLIRKDARSSRPYTCRSARLAVGGPIRPS